MRLRKLLLRTFHQDPAQAYACVHEAGDETRFSFRSSPCELKKRRGLTSTHCRCELHPWRSTRHFGVFSCRNDDVREPKVDDEEVGRDGGWVGGQA